MTSEIQIRPSGYEIRGKTLDLLMAPSLLASLKKRFPNAVVGHIAFGFTDAEEVLYLTHPRKEKRIDQSHFTVDSTESAYLDKFLEVIKEAVG